MRVLQAIYTSCPKGIENKGDGFQFYSYSDGFTSEELEELKKRGLYKASGNVATLDDIKNLCPVNFSYFRLESGRVGVLQTTYVGKVYSVDGSRWGNYVMHAFVLEDSKSKFPFAPISLYKSQSFRTELNEAEWNINEVPQKLPTLTLGDLKINTEITAKNASDFLREKDANGNFAKLIDAVIESTETKRGIAFAADKDIPRWIAALSFAMPAKFLTNLTFMTYSKDEPERDVVIRTGGRLDFEKHYAFDFSANKTSQIELETEYAKTAEKLMKEGNTGILSKFSEELEGYNDNTINREIDIAWKFLEAKESKIELSEKMLAFFFEYAKDDAQNAFWKTPTNISHKSCELALGQGTKFDELYEKIKESINSKQFADLMPLLLEKSNEEYKKQVFRDGIKTCAQGDEYQKQMLEYYIPTIRDKEELIRIISFADKYKHTEFLPKLLEKLEKKASFEKSDIDNLEKVVSIMEKSGFSKYNSEIAFFVEMQKVELQLTSPATINTFLQKNPDLSIKVCREIVKKRKEFYTYLAKNKLWKQLATLIEESPSSLETLELEIEELKEIARYKKETLKQSSRKLEFFILEKEIKDEKLSLKDTCEKLEQNAELILEKADKQVLTSILEALVEKILDSRNREFAISFFKKNVEFLQKMKELQMSQFKKIDKLFSKDKEVSLAWNKLKRNEIKGNGLPLSIFLGGLIAVLAVAFLITFFMGQPTVFPTNSELQQEIAGFSTEQQQRLSEAKSRIEEARLMYETAKNELNAVEGDYFLSDHFTEVARNQQELLTIAEQEFEQILKKIRLENIIQETDNE